MSGMIHLGDGKIIPGSHLCLVQTMQHLVDARVVPILRHFHKDRRLSELANRARNFSLSMKNRPTPDIDPLELDRILEEVLI